MASLARVDLGQPEACQTKMLSSAAHNYFRTWRGTRLRKSPHGADAPMSASCTHSGLPGRLGAPRSDQFQVFLSAVTSEFGKVRDELAADLRSRGILVKVQSDFRQEALSGTTIEKLHDYIRECSAVVCIIGGRSGSRPPPIATASFLHMLPPGVKAASYTQWEFFFARHYRRRLSIYVAASDYEPDKPATAERNSPALQQAFVHHIVSELGLDRNYFSNGDQLARAFT